MPKITRIEPGIKALPAKKKVAVYARVSKDTELLMHSVSAQVSYYSDLIQKNPEWEYAGVYADSGITGTLVTGHSEFGRLLEDCEAGKIDIILCKSVSRFVRNAVDLLNTVRWMFQMYIDGVTLRDIADSMNKAGIRTTLGNDFQEASVRQLIFNEVYACDICRQKCSIEDPITRRKVPNRGELPRYYMADSHEAIIDRDTYAKVKAEMERRASLVNPTYCFTGKFKYSVCGANFTRKKGRVRGKEYVDWICRSKKEPGVTRKSHNYPEHRLMDICA